MSAKNYALLRSQTGNTANSAIVSKLKSVNDDLLNVTSDRERLKKEVLILNNKYDDLQKRHANLLINDTIVKNNYQKLKHEYDELVFEHQVMNEQSKETIEKKDLQIKELNELLEKKNLKIKESDELLEKKNLKIKELNELLEKKDIELNEITARSNDSTKNTVESTVGSFNERQKSPSALDESLLHEDDELGKWRAMLDRINAMIIKLQRLLIEKDCELSNNRQQIIESKAIITELEKSLANKNTHYRDLIDKIKAHVQRLKIEKKENAEQIFELEESNATLWDRVLDLESKLSILQDQYQLLRNENEQLKSNENHIKINISYKK